MFQPLFLYVAYQAVHSANSYAPLQAPLNYIKRFSHIKDKKRRIFAGMFGYEFIIHNETIIFSVQMYYILIVQYFMFTIVSISI